MSDSDLRNASTTAIERVSRSLNDFLHSDERAAQLLAEPFVPDGSGFLDAATQAVAVGGMRELRLEKRRRLLQIAAFDASGRLSLEETGRALSDLADASLQATLAYIEAPDDLAVISMGKLGARELNYFSDIDVMFVAGGETGPATKAAETLLAELGGNSPEGQSYAIDANLRPQGRAGALVRSLDAFLEYYGRWAETWEFQALLKARASAGHLELGRELVDRTRALVFPDEVTPEHIASIRSMKERVEQHVLRTSRRSKSREANDVKLGPGGIRDIEFSVQLLQLVHGSTDPSVRAPATIDALLQLVSGGYIAEDDAAGLSVAYRWLRNVEHRLQLRQERRVRMLPVDDASRDEIARAMGFSDSSFESALDRFDNVHNSVLADVRGRFEKLFYRPMIESLAEGGGTKLSEDALEQRLRILGYRDVKRAARTLSGLVTGTSRRAKLLRLLTPAQLRWLASTPLPDEGLFGFLRVSEALGSRLDALGGLRDNPPGLEFLAKVLGSGRLLSEVLSHVPEELNTIADPRGPGKPKQRERLVREARASLEWREPHRRLDGLRRFKRREMLRVVLSDLAGEADLVEVGRGLADLADACLETALVDVDIPFAVIGMGKLGGRELNYSSDIDVMFVHDADPTAAERVAETLMKTIGEVTPEGQAFRIDAALRPEGKSGPLARSLDSFLEYYERWSRPWEHQALLRARVAAGNHDVGKSLIERTRPYAYPENVSPEVLGEIRHLKARMERERIPRGIEPRRHFKMGPGGTADVEFAVQILQLRHGHDAHTLRTQSTMEALAAGEQLDLLSESDVRQLRTAYTFLSSLRNRLFWLSGRPGDLLPVKPEDLEALAIAMGYHRQPRQELEEDYLRITRRARKVAERYIYE
jgi:[glutamine synthetase] adenylyltransferase / [glutamine synthetase]-adenylyl-L-tyrosine phosphorylase